MNDNSRQRDDALSLLLDDDGGDARVYNDRGVMIPRPVADPGEF